MLRDEGDRHHHEAHSLAPGALDLLLGRRSDPFERSHTALIANLPVEDARPERLYHGGTGLLDLPLIGIAARHDRLRQTMRREENTRPRAGLADLLRLRQTGAHQLGCGLHEARLPRIAAHERGGYLQPGARRRLAPSRPGGRRRGRRELRIERQQHDALGIPRFHGRRRLVGEGCPVAHRDEGFHRPEIAERCLKRPRLRLRVREKRRASTHLAVDLARHGRATPRDQLGDRPAKQRRQRDDGPVVEQIEEERLDGLELVGPAEIEEHDGCPFGLSHGRLPAAGARPSCPPASHDLDQCRHMLGWGRLHHAVPEIEDEGSAAPASKDTFGSLPHGLASRYQKQGVQVSLQCRIWLELARGPVERHGGIEADGIYPCALDKALVAETGSARKADDRHLRASRLDLEDDAPDRLDAPARRTRARRVPLPSCRKSAALPRPPRLGG